MQAGVPADSPCQRRRVTADRCPSSALTPVACRKGALVKEACIAVATIFATSAAFAETINFDNDSPGALPSAWQQGVTGKGSPKWAVRPDASAPSKPNVLQQSGSGAFPWCVLPKTAVEN